MKKGSRIIPFILVVIALAAGILFFKLQSNKTYRVEEVPEAESNLDSWEIETSQTNGLPIKEDKSIYEMENNGKAETVYLTVFPTRDENGETLTFGDFDFHLPRDKNFNPVLDANITFGDKAGLLPAQANADVTNATIRVRGNSSRGAKYKSYKVKMKEDTQEFQNQTTLNLNKHVYDISKITNKFCMDIMAPIPDIASFRTNFMIVYIRDASLPKEEQEFKYYGQYTHVEQPNKTYLRSRGLDVNGNLYKANNFEFRMTEELKNVDDPLYSEEAFETVLNIREGKDHTKVLKMIEDVNDVNKDFEETFSTYFNEENYLTWMACNVLLGNEDTIAHNFIIYSPQDSTTWYLLPWDYDGTFKFGGYESSFLVPAEMRGVQRMTGVSLHRRYFRQPGSIDKLTQKMNELMNNYFTKEKVNSLLQSYLPVLEQTLVKEPDLSLGEIPPNEYKNYLNGFYDQIRANYDGYMKSLDYPMPVFTNEPVKKSDGSLLFAWEPSYDFGNDLLKYNIKVASDVDIRHVIFEQNGLTENSYVYKQGLSAGTYYMKVTISDTEGHTQYSLDYYEDPIKGMQFGIRQIIIP